MAVVPLANAATIWNGPTIQFTHTPENGLEDQMTPGVAITRADSGGLYNAVTEHAANPGVSPADTEWAVGALTNYSKLTYAACPLEASERPPNDVGTTYVVHLINEDIYLSLTLNAWGGAGGSGDTSFTYTRTTPAVAAPTPSVAITNPVNGATFNAPATVNIEASATVSSGTVTNVQFFDNGISLGAITAPPFSIIASNLTVGSNSLTAVATAAGVSATSAVVNIAVIAAAPVPTVTAAITGVAAGTSYNFTITLTNTGTAALNSFWYGWTTSGNNLPSDPTSASNSLGWGNGISGNSIKWTNSSGTALAPGDSATFTFVSSSSPSAITTSPSGESVAYVGTIDFTEDKSGDSTAVFSPTLLTNSAPPPAVPTVAATIYAVTNGSSYDYTITLTNTGTNALNSFWYGWTTSGNNLPSNPTNASNSLGWSNGISGNSIKWTNSSGTALAPGDSATFTFVSSSTPSAITTSPSGESVAFVGAIDFTEDTAGDGTAVFSPTLVSGPPPIVSISAPELTVTAASNLIILTWPTNSAGFNLQTTTNLLSLPFWGIVSNPPVIVNGQFAVTNIVSGAQQFFRLANYQISPQFNQPNNVLIADQWNNRVIEITPSGQIIWSFGLGPKDFSSNSPISVNDAERVGDFTLMANPGDAPGVIPQAPSGAVDNRVLLVNPAGNIVWQYGQFGQTGDGPDLLNTPVQSTYLPGFNVLITDQGNNRVIEVNYNKQIVWQYPGSDTNASDQLNAPNSAELLANGNILIADQGNNRALEVTTADQIVTAFSAGGTVNTLAFATRLTNGDTLITDAGNARIVEVNAADQVVWQYFTTNTASTDGVGAMSVAAPQPTRAVRLSNGDTLISDQLNNRVIRVNSSGSIVADYGLPLPLNGNTFSGGSAGILIGGNVGYSLTTTQTGLYSPYDAKIIGDYTGLTPP